MSVSEALAKVNTLAALEAQGNENYHHDVLQAIRELQLAVETPIETTSRFNFQILQNICIRIAIEYGVLEAIAACKGQHAGISACEISQKTGLDALMTARIMRVLISIGLCDEIGDRTYAANEKTIFQTLPGSVGAEKHHFDLSFVAGGKLVDYMRGPGIKQFCDNPDDISIFKYTHGVQNTFELLEKNQEQKVAFDNYMTSRRMASIPQWFEIYPISELIGDLRGESDAVLLVDIGGGPGQELAYFHERQPKVPGRLILQDLALAFSQIEKIPDRIEMMEYDFFTPQPIPGKSISPWLPDQYQDYSLQVKNIGARFYYFRDIFHNWSDAKSIQILTNVVEAMDPNYSTLLIDDYVLPDTGASLRAAEMDILMWINLGGMERTVSQWEALFKEVGLDLIHIWHSPLDQESVLEVRKRHI